MNNRGISYLETISALALVGLAILAASSMTAAHPIASARLQAQGDMLDALDALLEGVRSGAVPAAEGKVQSLIETPTRVSLRLEILNSEIAGLTWVRATARASVRGRALERSLETALWSQP